MVFGGGYTVISYKIAQVDDNNIYNLALGMSQCVCALGEIVIENNVTEKR